MFSIGSTKYYFVQTKYPYHVIHTIFFQIWLRDISPNDDCNLSGETGFLI